MFGTAAATTTTAGAGAGAGAAAGTASIAAVAGPLAIVAGVAVALSAFGKAVNNARDELDE